MAEALDNNAASLFTRLAGYEENHKCIAFNILANLISESRMWFTYRRYALYKVAKSFQT